MGAPPVLVGRAAERLARSRPSTEGGGGGPGSSARPSSGGSAASTGDAPPRPLAVAVLSAPAPPSPPGTDVARDPACEVALTPATLASLGLAAGAAVELQLAARTDAPPRLATALAAVGAGGAGGGAGASPPPFADGVAYLSPLLAYNLGIQYQLAPFLSGRSAGEGKGGEGAHPPPAAAAHSPGGRPPPPALVGEALLLRRAPLPKGAARAAGAGSVAPVATRLVLSLIREPSSGGGGGATGEAAAGEGGAAPPAPSTTALHPLTTAVAAHFRSTRRVLSARDVVAVPSPDAGGDAAYPAALHGRWSGGSGGGLTTFLRVEALEPAGIGSLAIDPASTAVVLGGMPGAGTLPVGVRGFEDGLGMRSGGGALLSSTTTPPPALALPFLALGEDAWAGWSTAGPEGGGEGGAPPSALPAGLRGVGPLLPGPWRALAAALAPALVHAPTRLAVRASVLLTGPAGSGKATAVAAAAAALGLKLVVHTGSALRSAGAAPTPGGGPPPGPAAALAAAFESAHPYSPALLFIDGLDALCADASAAGGGGGGPGDGAPAPATTPGSPAERLACALRAGVVAGAKAPTATAAALGRPHLYGAHGAGLSAGSGRGIVLLVAAAAAAEAVPPPLRRVFTHALSTARPLAPRARAWLLRAGLGAAGGGLGEADWASLAAASSGLGPRDLAAVAGRAAAAAAVRACCADLVVTGQGGGGGGGGTGPPLPLPTTPPPVTLTDVEHALSALRRNTGAAAASRIPAVRWADVGGLAGARAAILDTVDLPLRHPSLFAGTGLRRRSGVLLYGPPGTGKTLLAKAVATECALSFIAVKGPELVNPYVGESERGVRALFARARAAAPAIIFFDELDALAPARGRTGDAGGVMDRVVAALLAEIDGAQGGGGGGGGDAPPPPIFIIGATNRPDLLDSALLRPGRLDRLVYVGVASDTASRSSVLAALTRRMALGACVDLGAVADAAPPTATGADLYALAADAWALAADRADAEAEAGGEAGEETEEEEEEEEEEEVGASASAPGTSVVVTQADFMAALAGLTPSLTATELAKYERLRAQYEGGGRAA